MKKISLIALVVAGAAILVLAGCDNGGGGGGGGSSFTLNTADFALINFDADGSGVVDGSLATNDSEVVDAEGGRILTYDPDGDGTADTIDGSTARLITGRFGDDAEISVPADEIWYINGTVFIGTNTQQSAARTNSAVLTVAAGAELRGIASQASPGTLVIDRNGQIQAIGTSANPIVFTSSNAAGSRASGDWGGIVINGSARVQGGQPIGEGGTGTYGGSLDSDDSGDLSYVRVEFAGTLFTPDNELNGISFNGVGDGTAVSYIQVHENADDGVEFFGGDVQVTYLVLTNNEDDSIDYDDGWQGSIQYAIIATNGSGDKAIEADGDSDANDDSGSLRVASDPIIANLSVIGNSSDAGPDFKSTADGELYNSWVVGYGAAAALDDDGAGDLVITGVAFEADAEPTAAAYTAGTNAYSATAAALIEGVSYTAGSSLDAIPSAINTVVAQTVPTTDNAGNTIVDTSFVGAVDVGGTDWYSAWITLAAD